mmetsp:Transcript_31722/g.104974  ORF Transcript_31722/g.104974 Transcript_31722/m.104974 type:complete len:232 (+) Transcript_31722:1365-2060(+)
MTLRAPCRTSADVSAMQRASSASTAVRTARRRDRCAPVQSCCATASNAACRSAGLSDSSCSATASPNTSDTTSEMSESDWRGADWASSIAGATSISGDRGATTTGRDAPATARSTSGATTVSKRPMKLSIVTTSRSVVGCRRRIRSSAAASCSSSSSTLTVSGLRGSFSASCLGACSSTSAPLSSVGAATASPDAPSLTQPPAKAAVPPRSSRAQRCRAESLCVRRAIACS